MIRFIKLLFYHIYLYYLKVDNGNKALAKFTTFLIFTLIFGIIFYFGYVLFFILYKDNIIINTPYIYYIVLFIATGSFVGSYVYSKKFENFDSFKDYNVKYYFYFFLIAGFAFALAFYSASINRERIFKQREIQKTSIEMEK